jgi:hypothetical protein
MLRSADLKETQIFSCLKEADLLWLSQHTADLHLEPGEYLIHEGEPRSFFVLMEGTTEIIKDVMGRRTEVTQHKAGTSSESCPFLWLQRLPRPSAQRRLAVWRGSIRSTSRS